MEVQEVLGMRLEDALKVCEAHGFVPEIVWTQPPKGREQGTVRVIRVRGNALTVSRFEDELQTAR